MDWASVITAMTSVALRKESVDRNKIASARGSGGNFVALRKESVDRNYGSDLSYSDGVGRSPQGERG